MKYVSGEQKPRNKGERALAKASKQIVGEVQLSGMKAEGVAALAGHIMDVATQLDQHRRELAGNDEVLNRILGEIEISAIRQMNRIQNSTFSQWGL